MVPLNPVGVLCRIGYSSAQEAKTPVPAIASTQAVKLTAEQEKSIKAMLKQNLKGFEMASLSSEQMKKAEEILGKAVKEVVIKREAAKITQDQSKKQAAALKESREKGAKPKQQSEEAFKAAGFSEEQVKVFKETQELMSKAKKEILKDLKPEQIEKLPEQLKKLAKNGK